MRKLKWNRTLTILVLMMFITVTYASFNTNLFIDGKAYVRVDRDIRITDIHLLETEYNGYENTNSEYTNRTISTDVSLPRQASSLTYEVTISNVSDRRYKITDIIEDSYDNKDVKYELLDASIGNIVEPHTTKTFRVKFTNNVTVVEEDDVYQTLTYTFDYTGGEQEFVVPYDGDYTLEVWGAQGGNNGGLGGYSIGKIQLKKGKSLFINVGGAGKKGCDQTLGNGVFINGGYNGGGSTYTWKDNKCAGSGGGATHISYKKGLLSSLENSIESILIVAGGGGGQGISGYGTAGSGGGYIGNSGTATDSWYGTGGTQEQGGNDKNYSAALVHSGFGQGTSLKYGNGSGGGGGYYGGGAGYGTGGFSGGGSGYIGNTLLYDKAMYCYKCAESSEDNTKTITTNDNSTTPEINQAKKGNGYAKITITRKIEDGSIYDFDYSGGEQIFTAPYTGIYKLETWGAQGGTINEDYYGGYGGYSIGSIKFNKGQIVYINNGGQGICRTLTEDNKKAPGGYNGGGEGSSGYSTRVVCGGGGATHIATATGLLSSLSSNRNSILIVSGGGAGSWYYDSASTKTPGHGGGYIGTAGTNNDGANCGIYSASGGTQTSAGEIGKVFGSFGQGGGQGYAGSAGGGGGYYGGNSTCFAGGGGSGYIGNTNLYDKIMYCYNCDETQDENTKTVATKSHTKMPKQNVAKEGNGYSKITLLKRTINQTKLTLDFTFEEYVNGNEYTFGFTGNYQTFPVPKTGYYKIELWGARGGYTNGSYGAYTTGKIKLNKGETLYVYVGERKLGSYNVTSFNGGTSSADGQPGGGATDIRLVPGEWNNNESLNSRIMVAAGGGAYAGVSPNLGYGGGLHGGVSYSESAYNDSSISTAATQTAAGVPTSACGLTYPSGFGVGGSCAGGGGGYYGGAGAAGAAGGGSGGSSFISGHNGSVAITSSSDRTPRNDSNGIACVDGTTDITCSKHYSNYVFTDTVMIDGAGYSWTTERSTQYSGMPTTDGTSTMIGNTSDGFAKITCLEEITDYSYDYTGDVQEFVAPYKGIYKVELWGAGGGDLNVEDVFTKGGSGSYTSGTITLNKNEKLNIYVGEKLNQQEDRYTFNGGGRASISTTEISSEGANGGGATDIRIVNGSWDDFDSLKSRIMVAAGGAAASQWGATNDVTHRYYFPGGAGGGLIGYSGAAQNFSPAVGATQLRGGLAATANGPTSSTYPVGGQFGKGGFGSKYSYTYNYGGGGGSGLFGGASGTAASMAVGSGSGGSSYISGHQGCVSIAESSTSENITFINDSSEIACNDATSQGYNSSGYNTDKECSNHYSGKVFTNTIMIDGKGYAWDSNGVGNTIVGMPSKDGRTTMTGNTGNGFARITLVEKIDTYKVNYDLDGGTIEKPRKSYSYYDDNITLKTPTKSGYTFTGWTGGKNLFDKTNPNEATVFINIAGTTAGVESRDRSIYVPVKSNTTYTISYPENVERYRAFSVPTIVDSQVNNLSGINRDGEKIITITTGPNDKYLYVNFQVDCDLSYYYDGLQIEEGEEVTAFEKHISTPTKNITIPTGSTGNRTYKANWIKNYQLDVNHFEDGEWIDRTGSSDPRYTNLKFDVYINGQLRATQVHDFNQYYIEGTTYELTNFTYDTDAFDLIVGNNVNTGSTVFNFNNPISGTLSQSLVNTGTESVKVNIELRAKS